MDDFFIVIYLLLILLVLIGIFGLPIAAFVITLLTKRKLNQRLAKLEALHGISPEQKTLTQQVEQLNLRIRQLEERLASGVVTPPPITGPPPDTEQAPQPVTPPVLVPSSVPTPVTTTPPAATPPAATRTANDIESMIGRRWVGWAAVSLILFATAFFLKYAFENRWIGEVGRVTIGIAGGVLMTSLGFRYFKRGWRIFAQMLTGGGVGLLYLSAYAAFGYYHLVPQKAAFVFLAILIAEAAALAVLYEAPAIAIMALVGGFLTPLLLHSDRDHHLALFGYLIAIDIGALAVLKRWRGLRTIAFLGTHILFWLWYDEHYHEQRLVPVLLFQTGVFLIFLVAYLVARLLRKVESTTIEDLWLLGVNPFVFFLTAHQLLNPSYHDWMGVFAIVMALLYAGVAKLLLDRATLRRAESLTLIGVALTFVTIAIPIQLRSNWITIAWAIEGLMMLWTGIETSSKRLRITACTLFGLALIKLLIWDSPYGNRGAFIPVFNRYFLSSLFVIGCLFGAAGVYQRLGKRKNISVNGVTLTFVLAAVVAFWLVSSVETHTFFIARALAQRLPEDFRHQRWLGQMALSVVWASYAAVLAAIGFLRRSSATRWAALSLFALTIIKAMFVDIAQLQQLYRIIVFFVLGVLLLLVAWGYHKAYQARESSS